MFETLIESDSSALKPRRRYFVISSVVVGILFISAVVISLYATDTGLGNDQFDVAAILAPVETAATEPEPPRPQINRTTHEVAEIAQRPTNTVRLDESPPDVPPISVTPSNVAARPNGPFKIGDLRDAKPVGEDFQDQPSTPGTGSSSSEPQTANQPQATEKKPDEPEPPPAFTRPRTLGVVNGIATSLPKPVYPAAAIAMRVEGKVDVQVTIDETGKVISAKAASGHPLLKTAAESAAWRARFTPTYLSKVPVKVTGVIVYNFTRN